MSAVPLIIPSCVSCGELAIPWKSLRFKTPTMKLNDCDILELSLMLNNDTLRGKAVCVKCAAQLVTDLTVNPPKIEYTPYA